MKQSFDKLEAFQCSLNILTKLHCNVPDAYDKGQATAELQRLSKQWHRDKDYVIMTVVQMAQAEVDAQLRRMVQQIVEELQLPITEEKFRESWENLSEEEKMQLVDSTISLMEGMKEEG